MIERLLEDWLDNASERSYQPCFVQMLTGKGYRVVHSTRHCALEYGKDVIAVAPDGTPCAYQLKGKPGGRLGLSEFVKDIQPQLGQLISQPLIYPGVPDEVPHRSYLVCNGYFEEEVQRAVDDLNRAGYRSKIELIGRGDLLNWAKIQGADLWPSELSTVRELLELFLHDGRDVLPVEQLASIMESTLGLRLPDSPFRAAALKRATTSAALLCGIATAHFASEENYFAVASAWCLFIVNTIAACERSGIPIQGAIKESLYTSENAIKDSIVALWNEVQTRTHLVEGNSFADPEIYRWRYTLLCGLFSVLWFFPGDTSEDIERREAITEWLNRNHEHLHLWGEGAVPSMLAWLLFRRRADASMRPDHELAELLRAVLMANQKDSNSPLPDPYYDFDAVARYIYKLEPTDETSNLSKETFTGASYTAEALLHLLARSRFKWPCRSNWPNFNRLGHKRFVPAAAWQYGLFHCEEGTEEMRQYPLEYKWEKLCADADTDTCDYLPQELALRPHVLLLWVIIAPHRMTSDICHVLSGNLPK